MPFADSHTHLYYKDFDSDREQVIENCKTAGVDLLINVGTCVETSNQCLELARKYPFMKATAGIHPNDCANAGPEDVQKIAELLKDKNVVGIGEVGLDYYRDHAPREKQAQILNAFIDFYEILDKPLVIHCRDAYEDLASIFHRRGKKWKGVMHCFSSNKDTMQKFLDLGFYISFAGPLTYKKNDELREACKACPVDRLLLETDAPFLPPQTMRGKRNEPAYMLETAHTAAELHGLSLEEIGRKTSQNTRALFGVC